MQIRNTAGEVLFEVLGDTLVRADLRGAVLREADLRGADLRGANLGEANLGGADLSGADLSRADLSDANLGGADLSGASLRGAILRRADLSLADLSATDLHVAVISRASLRVVILRKADLSLADLSATDLRGADLYRANLRGAVLPPPITPPEGEFIGYKKVRQADGTYAVITLRIPIFAQRTSALASRKCRACHVEVVEGEGISPTTIRSKLRYAPGTVVTADRFNADRREECTNGIHFFMTLEEAEAYQP